MMSYTKNATTICLYDMSRNVSEDLIIAFLQSNLFWQVSCARSKTKARTGISSWSILSFLSGAVPLDSCFEFFRRENIFFEAYVPL